MPLIPVYGRARRLPHPAPETSQLRRNHGAIVDCGVYVKGRRVPSSGLPEEALRQARRGNGFVWIGIHEPTADEFAGIAKAFGLHPLAVEDAINAHQRPKIERYDSTVFAVLKTVTYVPHESVTETAQIVESGEVMVFVGEGFVVTVRHGDHGGLRDLRRHLEADSERLAEGPFAVMHAVADRVVDDYVAVTESVQDDVDEIEASVLSARRSRDIERVYQLKREVLELKRSVAPLAVPLRMFIDHYPWNGNPLASYFRDIEDHVVRARDQINGYDELLDSILQVAFAQTQIAENEDMRKISAWVAIAAVPTMVAAIYGMNFENMPELRWRYGYYFVLVFIAIVCAVLYRGFKRNGWL